MMGRYFADTEGGSSGSPVIAHGDHCVVVVHAGTFGCDDPNVPGNTGTITSQVISDLGADAPADAVVTSGLCNAGFPEVFTDGFESGNTSAWSSTSS